MAKGNLKVDKEIIHTPVLPEPECRCEGDLLLGEGFGPGRPVALVNIKGLLA